MQLNLEKYRFFQEVQLWPYSRDLNYESWLKNFTDGEEQEIASRILNFFVYIPEQLVNQLLVSVFSKCGAYFKRVDESWVHKSFKDNCWYSFIPGESPNPTDSGNFFSRKLRDVIGIPEDRILDFSNLILKLETSISYENVILVDDFVGSGAQCDNAWNKQRYGKNLSTLSEIANAGGHHIIYAPLLMNYMGYDRIKRKCNSLELAYIHKLGPEYNLFSKECPCWESNEKLYRKGIDLILRKSEEIGIKSSFGCSVIDIKGFGCQGLALAFAHGMPDACPPFFYWTQNWIPLIKKYYHRS